MSKLPRHGDGGHDHSAASSFNNANLPVSSVGGHSPPGRVGPCACLPRALIHQRSLPTEQQVCDLVTWLFVGEGFSRRHGNWFMPPPITHRFALFDWPVSPKEAKRRKSEGLWDEE
ncbi:hypothetical protein JOB18_034500 [Solea senegalensis]|uniref:Uncharacterized protein n=1 Tax=Solea senegalensis TaxID=28829 RepID=A0AAV6SN20_SOLSE|nr:hypothetical protein JOB18_034500 [Solea senegalensis]